MTDCSQAASAAVVLGDEEPEGTLRIAAKNHPSGTRDRASIRYECATSIDSDQFIRTLSVLAGVLVAFCCGRGVTDSTLEQNACVHGTTLHSPIPRVRTCSLPAAWTAQSGWLEKARKPRF